MKTVRAVASHPLAGPTIRYGISGCVVTSTYLGIPLVLNGALGIAIEVVIPIAYLVAATLHFNLQRHFVFRHVTEFALTTRQQIMRYVGVFAVQYPLTAVFTAVLPGALGVSPRVVFVCTALSISFSVFLLLRSHVFHGSSDEGLLEAELQAELEAEAVGEWAARGEAQRPTTIVPR